MSSVNHFGITMKIIETNCKITVLRAQTPSTLSTIGHLLSVVREDQLRNKSNKKPLKNLNLLI